MSKPSRTPVRKAPDDDALAWALAAVAHPYLSRPDADRIYIAIGIGETFTAIDALLTAIAREESPSATTWSRPWPPGWTATAARTPSRGFVSSSPR